jgi:hypothetical protein
MANNFPWEQFDKVTFEGGLCINKHKSGEWFYVNSIDPMPVSDPGTVKTSLGVRPVLAEGSDGNARVSFVFPAARGNLLEIYSSELDLPGPLTYLMGSMLYHCSALARIYADECTRFVETRSIKIIDGERPSWEKEKRVVTRLKDPLYGFETLITKILIGYESIRYPIWKKYNSGKDTPRSFVDTVKSCKFPSAIGKRIQLSTTNCYLPAKKFRNCIQHNLDIGSSSWCILEKKHQLLWSLMVRLPDNPEEKSAKDFKFDQGLDALTVAWEYVSEFFALTDIILGKGNLSSA